MENDSACTTFDSPLGWIHIACSPRGIAALDLCGAEPPNTGQCGHRSSRRGTACDEGRIGTDSATLHKAKEAVLAYLFERVPVDPSLPVDLSSGTAFQQSVWSALREIPFGRTRSYGEIARSIGKPLAARAVGQACGRNPVAILVPCHRVIGQSGKLTGFGGGIHIKEKLLDLERTGILAGPG